MKTKNQGQETKPNGVAINKMSKAPKSGVALQLVREKGKTPFLFIPFSNSSLISFKISSSDFEVSGVLPLDWAMDRITPIIQKQIALTREDCEKELIRKYPIKY